MHTTLEKLEEHIQTENPFHAVHRGLKEAKIFALLFVGVYCINTLITNFDLFVLAFDANDINQPVLTEKFAGSLQSSSEEKAQKTINHRGEEGKQKKQGEQAKQGQSGENSTTESMIAAQKKQRKVNDIKRLFQQHTPAATSDFDGKEKMSSLLRQKLNDYTIDFNRLPPVHRLIIPSIGVDVPLINPDYDKPIEEVTNEDFEADLFKGVVKYPTTPSPGDHTRGHTMIFGHSSYQSWENNEYATVFAKTTQLQDGDTIEIVWGGQLHTYKVVEKQIIHPSQIANMYTSFSDGNYISLIACYPLGSTAKRSIIIAERIT